LHFWQGINTQQSRWHVTASTLGKGLCVFNCATTCNPPSIKITNLTKGQPHNKLLPLIKTQKLI